MSGTYNWSKRVSRQSETCAQINHKYEPTRTLLPISPSSSSNDNEASPLTHSFLSCSFSLHLHLVGTFPSSSSVVLVHDESPRGISDAAPSTHASPSTQLFSAPLSLFHPPHKSFIIYGLRLWTICVWASVRLDRNAWERKSNGWNYVVGKKLHIGTSWSPFFILSIANTIFILTCISDPHSFHVSLSSSKKRKRQLSPFGSNLTDSYRISSWSSTITLQLTSSDFLFPAPQPAGFLFFFSFPNTNTLWGNLVSTQWFALATLLVSPTLATGHEKYLTCLPQ